MKTRLLLAFVLITLLLASCAPDGPEIGAGTIRDSRFTPSGYEVKKVPAVIGKITTIIPIRLWIPDTYEVLLDDGEIATWVSVTKEQYECVSEGDYIILNGGTWCGGGNE